MHGLPNCQKRLTQFFPSAHPIQTSSSVSCCPKHHTCQRSVLVPSPDTLRHISIGRNTMPRVSRCNPVRDGMHDGDEEPPKSTSHTAKKTSLPTTKRTTTKGAASAKTRPLSTKSANSKGNKIAGMPNKRGKQIVSFSTTRNSPQGRSTGVTLYQPKTIRCDISIGINAVCDIYFNRYKCGVWYFLSSIPMCDIWMPQRRIMVIFG
jgi:hypothetical protein